MCGLWSTALACALPDGGPCGIHTHLASCCWTTATEALARTSCSSPALSAPGHSGSEQAQQASSPLHGVCWHPPPGTRHSLQNHQVHRKPTNVVELHEKRDCGGPALRLARGVLHQQNQRLKALCVRPNSPSPPGANRSVGAPTAWPDASLIRVLGSLVLPTLLGPFTGFPVLP